MVKAQIGADEDKKKITEQESKLETVWNVAIYCTYMSFKGIK